MHLPVLRRTKACLKGLKELGHTAQRGVAGNQKTSMRQAHTAYANHEELRMATGYESGRMV